MSIKCFSNIQSKNNTVQQRSTFQNVLSYYFFFLNVTHKKR